MSAPLDLKAKIVTWLEKTGLPLELATESAFRAAGFHVGHSQHYDDPETGKSREIDVVAVLNDGAISDYVAFVIECKASPNPWIVITSNDPAVHDATFGYLGLMSECFRPIGVNLGMHANSIMRAEGLPTGGYMLKQAFSGDHDPGFVVSNAVVNAARAVRDSTPKVDIGVFVIPAIVVDAPLFQCKMLPDGTFDLEPCELTALHFAASDTEMCLVRIATRSGLDRLISHCKNMTHYTLSALKYINADKGN